MKKKNPILDFFFFLTHCFRIRRALKQFWEKNKNWLIARNFQQIKYILNTCISFISLSLTVLCISSSYNLEPNLSGTPPSSNGLICAMKFVKNHPFRIFQILVLHIACQCFNTSCKSSENPNRSKFKKPKILKIFFSLHPVWGIWFKRPYEIKYSISQKNLQYNTLDRLFYQFKILLYFKIFRYHERIHFLIKLQ